MLGQTVNLPTVDMQGGQYYFYEVENGDSAYGIAKKFGWDYDEFCRLNPQVIKNLKKGALVYYPTGKAASGVLPIPEQTAEARVITHVVRKGETLYSIAGKYNIPIETIYANHPSARDGIKEGETIRIDRTVHTSATPVAEAPDNVQKSEVKAETEKTKSESTANAVADNTPVINDNSNTNKTTAETAVKDTVATAPQEVVSSTPESPLVNLVDVLSGNSSLSEADVNRQRVSNIAILLDAPELSRDREFMRGFLLALKEMESTGQKVLLTALDAGKGETSVTQALDSIHPDAIMLTYEKDLPQWIVNYGNKNSVSVVNVFDVKYSETGSNPSIVQVLTPSKEFFKSVAEYVNHEMGDRKLIFVNSPLPSDGVAEELKNIWNPQETMDVPFDNLLDKDLREDGKYVFYVNGTKKDEVSKVLDKIAALKEKTPLAEVKVIGRPNWVTFATPLQQQFCANDVYIPSRFYVDWNSPAIQGFVNEYEKTYKRHPAKTFPVFSISGYDIAQCFIPSLAANDGDLSKGMLRGNTLQSDFILERSSTEGGYLNKAVYLVRFTPLNTIEKIIAE